MPQGFLHGVETIASTSGARTIQTVRTAVIGIVGTAPTHHVQGAPELNKPTLVASEVDAAKFGPQLPGYTIPAALAALAKYAGPIVVINVFDPAVHRATVAEAPLNITADKTIQLAHKDVLTATVKTSADAACVEGADYTIDRKSGLITIKATGNLSAAANAKVAYTYADPSAVDETAIIGGTDVGGSRHGIPALLNAKSVLGFKPKILIAPGYSSSRDVIGALATVAQSKKLRAIVLADVPAGTSVEDAIEGRGPAGSVDLGIFEPRVFWCGPHLKSTRGTEPMSTHLAGLIALTDQTLGYWHSPSNKPFSSDVMGTEFPITAEYSDELCDANRLNAVGIVTAFAQFGAALRAWGNRSAAFPTDQDVMTFMSVLRVRDMIDETIEEVSGQRYTDGPITQAFIDGVLADTNELIRTLIGRGALMPGSQTTFNKALNPSSQLSAGKVTFSNTWASPPPAELITWQSTFDTSLLAVG